METMHVNEHTTVRMAKDWLRARLRGGKAQCPTCEQLAKVYRRPLTGGMAAFLILAQRESLGEWFHVQALFKRSAQVRATNAAGDFAKLRFWGFIEEEQILRADGGRAGWWRVTTAGAEFAAGRTTVPKYSLIYDNRFLAHEGDDIRIWDALGTKFDYRELMDS